MAGRMTIRDMAVEYLCKARKAHATAYQNALRRNGVGSEELIALLNKLMAVEWLLREIGEDIDSEWRENG